MSEETVRLSPSGKIGLPRGIECGAPGILAGLPRIWGRVGISPDTTTSNPIYPPAQMSRLIDLVVFDCKAQGIETMTPWQLDALKSRWGAAQPMGGGA